jgi:hypothetical protein
MSRPQLSGKDLARIAQTIKELRALADEEAKIPLE